MRSVHQKNIDEGAAIDWGHTAADYARYRPGPPESFFARLVASGVGKPGQRILDLATGTGVLAREFARRGCEVTGVDVAQGQVAMAKQMPTSEGLTARWIVTEAEATGLADRSFDVITAQQCWMYFDPRAILRECARLLVPGGLLMIGHASFFFCKGAVVAASEALVLRHNPAWQGVDWDGVVEANPDLASPLGRLESFFAYEEGVAFTAESWRGRMRALRGIGASLDAAAVAAFDKEHAELLARIAPPSFSVLHGFDAHVFRFEAR